MKYCEDCKYIILSDNHEKPEKKLEYATCGAPKRTDGNFYVSRKFDRGSIYCSTCRSSELDHDCGPEARFYEEES